MARIWLAKFLRQAAGVSIVWPGVAAPNGFCSVRFTREGGAIYFDAERATVGRVLGFGPMDVSQVDLRNRFARHVPSPMFAAAPGGTLVVEEFLEGSAPSTFSGEPMATVIRQVLGAYTALVSEETCGDSLGWVTDIRRPEIWSSIPDDFRAMIRKLDLDEVAGWPTVPTSPDVVPQNVLVDHVGAIHVIDVLPIVIHPFIVAPLTLVAFGGRSARGSYLSGAFDDELVALGDAAGVSLRPDDRSRPGWLALAFLIHGLEFASDVADWPVSLRPHIESLVRDAGMEGLFSAIQLDRCSVPRAPAG